MFIPGIHTFIQFLSKKQRGFFIDSDEIDSCINRASLDLFKRNLGLPEEYQPGRPVPRIADELTQKLIDEMKFFKETVNIRVVNSRVNYPSDYVYVRRIGSQAVAPDKVAAATVRTSYDTRPKGFTFYDTTTNEAFVKASDKSADWKSVTPTEVDEVDDSKWYSRINRITSAPSFDIPICNFQSTYLEVAPSNLPNIILTYLRTPAKVMWDYTIVNGRQVFAETGGINGNSVDIDWPELSHNDIISRACSYLGLVIEDESLEEYSRMKIAKGE